MRNEYHFVNIVVGLNLTPTFACTATIIGKNVSLMGIRLLQGLKTGARHTTKRL